jgi:rRNA maturation RNase YbeY
LAALAFWAMRHRAVREPAELSIAMVDSELIRQMNADYRGIDRATDVLSFSAIEDENDQIFADQPLALGDILICPEVVDRIDYGAEFDFEQKLEVIVIHGILHLLGYDHEQTADALQMEALEDELYDAWSKQINRQDTKSARDSALTAEADRTQNIPSNNNQQNQTTEKGTAFRQTLKWAIEGILAAINSERNMKIHLVAVVLVMIIGMVLRVNLTQWAILVFCCVMVLSTEMLNTAVEAIVDLVSPDRHPQAKQAKDIAAGAVLITVIGAVIVGLTVFVSAALIRLMS